MKSQENNMIEGENGSLILELFSDIRMNIEKRTSIHNSFGEEVNGGSVLKLDYFPQEETSRRIVRIKTNDYSPHTDDDVQIHKDVYGKMNSLDELVVRMRLDEIEKLKPNFIYKKAKILLVIENDEEQKKSQGKVLKYTK